MLHHCGSPELTTLDISEGSLSSQNHQCSSQELRVNIYPTTTCPAVDASIVSRYVVYIVDRTGDVVQEAVTILVFVPTRLTSALCPGRAIDF